MLHFRPSLPPASIVATTALFATSTFAQSEPELIALAAPGDEPAAFPKAEKAWVREIPASIGSAQS